MSTAAKTNTPDFRIIDTKDAHIGPTGVLYVYDAARPFCVLFNSNRGEICSARCSTQARAEIVMAAFVAARARYAARNLTPRGC